MGRCMTRAVLTGARLYIVVIVRRQCLAEAYVPSASRLLIERAKLTPPRIFC